MEFTSTSRIVDSDREPRNSVTVMDRAAGGPCRIFYTINNLRRADCHKSMATRDI